MYKVLSRSRYSSIKGQQRQNKYLTSEKAQLAGHLLKFTQPPPPFILQRVYGFLAQCVPLFRLLLLLYDSAMTPIEPAANIDGKNKSKYLRNSSHLGRFLAADAVVMRRCEVDKTGRSPAIVRRKIPRIKAIMCFSLSYFSTMDSDKGEVKHCNKTLEMVQSARSTGAMFVGDVEVNDNSSTLVDVNEKIQPPTLTVW